MQILRFIIFCLLMSPSVSVCAQQENLSNQIDTIPMLQGKWKMFEAEVMGRKMELPKDVQETYNFNPDGSFSQTDGPRILKGTWQYKNPLSSFIIDTKIGKSTYKIIKLSSSDLIVYTDFEGVMGNLHFRKQSTKKSTGSK